jgi:hypothetical protein
MTLSLPTIALSTLAMSFWNASANHVACSWVTGIELLPVSGGAADGGFGV